MYLISNSEQEPINWFEMKLNYRTYGVGPLKLVILHGLLGSSQNWHTAASKLSESFLVIVPDLRNHGESPHGAHSIDLMQKDLLDLLDELNLAKACLLGHSMGGLVAMQFALTNAHRLQALIVEDIAPGAQMKSMAGIFNALNAIDLTKVSRRQDADEQLSKSLSSPLLRQFLLQNLKRQDDGTFGWRCNLPELHRFVQKDAPLTFDPRAHFAGPTLFIAGELSAHRIAALQERISRPFPNHQLVTIANAGHWVHFDAMPQFVQTVTEFIHGL